jgi:Ran GTPase-activating protein (RanGAP) involved in mRNA processing and transport
MEYLKDYIHLSVELATTRLLNNDIFKLFVSSDSTKTNDGFANFCNALKQNTSLTCLNIQNRNINNKSIELLSDVLKENNTLELLDIYKNNIGPQGVKILCEGLAQNTTLKTLYLTSNNIKDEGVKYIYDLLKFNKTLCSLSMGYNSVTEIGVVTILELLKTNETLNKLHISDLTMDIEALYDVLKDNFSITTLFFANNDMQLTYLLCRNKHNLELKAKRLVDL